MVALHTVHQPHLNRQMNQHRHHAGTNSDQVTFIIANYTLVLTHTDTTLQKKKLSQGNVSITKV